MSSKPQYNILFQDDYLVAIDKPAGSHVHPPESLPFHVKKIPRELIVLYNLRDQINKRVYPVHRLDVATSGTLVFALSSEVASKLCSQFSNNEVQKKYLAMCRGFTHATGRIDISLESDSSGDLLESITDFKTLAQLELPIAVGKKFKSARYTLLEALPQTGRYHQIRRHFNRISHPIIGDTDHGDSHHNRFVREHFNIQGLCLLAHKIKFTHPVTQNIICIETPYNSKWKSIFEIFDTNLHKESTSNEISL